MSHKFRTAVRRESILAENKVVLKDRDAKELHHCTPKLDNTCSETSTFPLLNLPVELRLHIWAFAVTAKGLIKLSNHHLPPKSKDKRSTLAIVLTCRQVYLEAASLYYSLKTFVFPTLRVHCLCVSGLRRFAEAIGPENTKCLTSVRLATSRAQLDIFRTACFPAAATVFIVKAKKTSVIELNGEGVNYISRSNIPKILTLLELGKNH